MITKASGLDKQDVYKMWKSIFAQDDGGYTDFYFRTHYRNGETFVKKENNHVVGCASKHPHPVMMNDRLIQCSMILGVAVLKEQRGKGIMKELMKAMLDECDHQELITMIQAYNPKLYEPFGFKTVYTRKIWKITANEVKRINPQVSTTLFPKECVKLYGKFVSRFNGYIVRDEKYYELLIKEIEAENGRFVGYYNTKNQLEGYGILYLENNKLTIREAIYLNSVALNHIVNYALNLRHEIKLETSGAENLTKLFPNSEMIEEDYTMVRLNNPELFNRLFNCNVKTVEQAMKLHRKPLYMHENK